MERLKEAFAAIRERRIIQVRHLSLRGCQLALISLVVLAATLATAPSAAAQSAGDRAVPAAQETSDADTTAAAADTTAVADTAAAAPDTTTSVGDAIPPTEIPSRAEGTIVELRDMAGRLEPEAQLSTWVREVQVLVLLVGRERAAFDRTEIDELSNRELEDLRQRWLSYRAQLEGWQQRLSDKAQLVVAERERAREIEQLWRGTRAVAEAEEYPAALIGRMETVLATTEAVTRQVRHERDVVLTLEDDVSQEILETSTVLETIDAAREIRFRGLLTPEAPPLWVALQTRRDSLSAAEQVRRSLAGNSTQLREYFATTGRSIRVHLGIFTALLLLMVVLWRVSLKWPSDDPNLEESARILRRPIASALLVALALTREVYPTAPLVLFDLSRLLLLVPVLRLLPKRAYARLSGAVYVTAALFVLYFVPNLAVQDSLLQRLALLGWTLLALIAFVALARPGGLLTRLGAGRWTSLALLIGRLGAVGLSVSLLSNLFGYLDLARYLANVTLASAYFAIAIFALYLVLEGVWRAIVRSGLAKSLKALRVYVKTAERRGLFLLRAGGLTLWLTALLSVLGVDRPVVDAASALLTAELQVGSVAISVANVLAFALTLWLAIVLSGIVRAVLAEDVFPRTRHARAADTISTVVHWALLLVGFLFAAAAAGFEIGRLTLLAGAFGVGIGFGLQDVVNNFVSGLILAFERPIQVGDIVALGPSSGNLDGTVSRIGMRSSVIRTFSGAEVIVPNSNLISNQMINWTRSDRLRRVEISVGVAYGTDQRDVSKVLMQVAEDHPDILEHPEPSILLRGFGDSSLNFELRFWTYRFDGFRRVQSEVTRVILDALNEAGITIPFPQRDLHVKSIGPGGPLRGTTSGEVAGMTRVDRADAEDGAPLHASGDVGGAEETTREAREMGTEAGETATEAGEAGTEAGERPKRPAGGSD